MVHFNEYELVVGLECHIQLQTNTKLFSPAKNHFGDDPNTNVDIVDAGLPGVLPVFNEKVAHDAIRLGLALGCDLQHTSVFARKHYFYPDLPKGYQISQYELPICLGGSLTFPVGDTLTTIALTRIHIEEDAGKNIHVDGGNASFVDYNRAGTPLLELVTEPNFRSSSEAMEFVRHLRQLVMYLGICDGNMQEGSLRADANVSVRKKGSTAFGTRTEVKNLNSMRYLGQAIDHEMNRQILELEAGHVITQETRLWDPSRKETRPLRSKEDAHDYRYFPDPDLEPLVLEQDLINKIGATQPELPEQKRQRYVNELALTTYDAGVLVSEKAISDYFERAYSTHSNAKGIANWIINDVLRVSKLVSQELSEAVTFSCAISPEQIALLVKLIDDKIISGKIAKEAFEALVENPDLDLAQLVDSRGWRMSSDSSTMDAAVAAVIEQHPAEVQKYLNGKQQLFGFLMGQVMKATNGKVDPSASTDVLRAALEKLR